MAEGLTSVMNPIVQSFFHDPTFTVSHLVIDPETREAAVIDPVLDFDHKSGRTGTAFADKILAAAARDGARIAWVLETHAHADHLTAAPYLSEKTGAKIGIGAAITKVQKVFKTIFNVVDMPTDGSQFDHLFGEGERFPIGRLSVEVMATPGHTPACVSYKVGNAVFVGDTLFMPDYGTARADFPGGDARMLYRSIRRVLALPAETHLFLCHDYGAPGRQDFAWESTVGEERARNIHVHDGIGEEEFVAMRRARDKTLEMPVLILPSIQVNMRAGQFPAPEPNGTVYLKLPVNRL
jgi:glyoxylase-like metal-dependent hydrolase (beta-lactamase superfamily II)